MQELGHMLHNVDTTRCFWGGLDLWRVVLNVWYCCSGCQRPLRGDLVLQSKQINLCSLDHSFKHLELLSWQKEQQRSQQDKVSYETHRCNHQNYTTTASAICVCSQPSLNLSSILNESYHICQLGNGHFKIHCDRIRHIFHWPDELVILREEFVK